ncbi:hypothetical protein M422DRAFT_48001 [Sphaerobolus stellatus SS14]|uniref:Uncharacterized protein n=1 Tax=Sphaerobolus stellatus (strain SS14) TaxID=990650 RepID=A0A0C9VWI6_SPHS4|nr:hypothetical protein M422DRAFT_48001 [Sphaerobolus stellatus SS14]
MSVGGRAVEYHPTMDVAVQHEIVLWALQSTTDPDVITLAAEMVPFVYWPAVVDIGVAARQLQYTFNACFDARGDIIPGGKSRARACYRAAFHTHFLHLDSSRGSILDHTLLEKWFQDGLQVLEVHIGKQDPVIAFMEYISHTSHQGDLGQNIFNNLNTLQEKDLVWFFRVINQALACTAHSQSMQGIRPSNVHVMLQLYRSRPPTSNVTSQLLLWLAMKLGFRPNSSFLELLDKSGFESKLLDEILVRHWNYTYDNKDLDFLWSVIISKLSSSGIIQQYLPWDLSVHREHIPALAWTSTLANVGWLCSHLHILHSMIFLYDSVNKFDHKRLWKFYEVFNSPVKLLRYQVHSLIQDLKECKEYLNNDISPLLLALGMVKWPEDLEPNELYVNMLIASLEASGPHNVGLRQVALQAAWCYCIQLQKLSKSVKSRLLSALLNFTTSHDRLWEDMDGYGRAASLTILLRFTHYFGLIRSLCRSSGGQYPKPESHIISPFMSTIETVITLYFGRIEESKCIDLMVNLLAMLQELKEVYLPSSSNTLPEKEDTPIIISVWQYLSELQAGLDAWCYGSLACESYRLFDIQEKEWWISWRAVCEWSIEEYTKMDSVWLHDLASNVQQVYEVVEPWLERSKGHNARMRAEDIKDLERFNKFACTLREDLQKKSSMINVTPDPS